MLGGGGEVGVDLLEKVTFEQRLREVSRVSLVARTTHAKALRQEYAWCVEEQERGHEAGGEREKEAGGCGEQIKSGHLT